MSLVSLPSSLACGTERETAGAQSSSPSPRAGVRTAVRAGSRSGGGVLQFAMTGLRGHAKHGHAARAVHASH